MRKNGMGKEKPRRHGIWFGGIKEKEGEERKDGIEERVTNCKIKYDCKYGSYIPSINTYTPMQKQFLVVTKFRSSDCDRFDIF